MKVNYKSDAKSWHWESWYRCWHEVCQLLSLCYRWPQNTGDIWRGSVKDNVQSEKPLIVHPKCYSRVSSQWVYESWRYAQKSSHPTHFSKCIHVDEFLAAFAEWGLIFTLYRNYQGSRFWIYFNVLSCFLYLHKIDQQNKFSNK